jgi:hypothetical protein
MEETREQQKLHGFLQCVIYLSIMLEAAIFIYHDAPFWGFFIKPLDKIGSLFIYHELVYSKLATFSLICLVSIGTLAKALFTRAGHPPLYFPIPHGSTYFTWFAPLLAH